MSAAVPLLMSPAELRDRTIAATRNATRPPIALSCSWYMPNVPKSPHEEYERGPRLPNAARFDVDAIANTDYSVPGDNGKTVKLGHMLPSAETFFKAVGALGITREDHVVCYDSMGVFSSPRVAWTFRAMGHEKVSVLDGGLPRWIHEGFETDVGPPRTLDPTSGYGAIDVTILKERVSSYDQVVKNSLLQQGPEQALVLDARSGDRFNGTASEPRPGLSSGHIPRSHSMPFTTLLSSPSPTQPSFQTLLPKTELQNLFQKELSIQWPLLLAGKHHVVTTCGSGMTAAVIWLALRIAGVPEDSITLYDESWTGYASRPESTIVTQSM